MIYLDNAATTFPKPDCVYDRVDSIQRTIAVNVGRGGYKAATAAMQIVDETRKLMAELVGAASPEDVVFTSSATAASNEIIYGLEWDQYKTVYVTPYEHNAIARPLHMICERHGIKINLLPFNPKTQGVDMDELERMFAMNSPDYVFLNQVSNVTGTVVPVHDIALHAKEYGAIVVVDGSQAVGLIETDLQKTPIDYLIFAGHKNLYASWGIGGFIRNSDNMLRPVFAGGTGSDSLNLSMSMDYPIGFESGSPNIIAIASLNESLKWLKKIGIHTIEEHKKHLVARLVEGIKKTGATLYMPADSVGHTSVVSLTVAGYEANEVGMILDEDYDIAVRTGYHCAPFVHKFIGTEELHGTVRVSVGFFNSEEDIDAIIAAVDEITRS